jgi:hypothetical protein
MRSSSSGSLRLRLNNYGSHAACGCNPCKVAWHALECSRFDWKHG